MKESGRYRLFAEGSLGKGDFNIYRMFVELALRGTRTGGRAAQIVLENLYNGANAAAIRRHLFESTQVSALIAFENTKKVWFDIDTRQKFCLYIAQPGGKTYSFGAAFGVNSTEKVAALSAGLPINMPVSLVEEFSPDALAIAEVAHPADIEVSRKIYDRFPKFGSKDPGLARREYMTELHMGNDRDDFGNDPNGVPVYEGRMVEAFDHRAKAYVSGRGRSAVWRELNFGSVDKNVSPQWRVAVEDLPEKTNTQTSSYRIGFCDVGGVTNSRFLMAALIPPNVICGHSVPTIMFDPPDSRLMQLWLGVANSFVLDFLARKKAALHMSYTVMDSLPLPRKFEEGHTSTTIAERCLKLAATGPEMSGFRDIASQELGLDPKSAQPVEDLSSRASLRAELDVLVARDLFGLSRDEMRYVLDPGDILGRDCGFETFGALMRAEFKASQAFLTRDLILSTWDSLPKTSPAPEAAILMPASLVPPSFAISDLPNLPNLAWARHDQHQAAAAQAILVAVLKVLGRPAPVRQVRQAAVLCLNPCALLSRLTPKEQVDWRRVVGTEAEPLQGVSQFTSAVNSAWREATVHLRATGRLQENLAEDTWAAGQGLDLFPTAGWGEGRAQFVVSVLQRAAANSAVEDAEIEEQISALAG